MFGVWIKNFGCQTNDYDASKILTLLQGIGYCRVGAPEEAHLIILNTCHVREKATEKVFSDLGRLRPLKAGPLAPKILVTGCVAKALGPAVQKRAPWVDFVVAPQEMHRIPALLQASLRAHPLEEDICPSAPPPSSPTALLVVQEGCDHRCSYCVVPFTRGRAFSRPVAVVLEEAQTLLQQGAREITLVGHNVNMYAGEDASGELCDFSSLVLRIAALPTIQRLRYMTSHPQYMTPSLLQAHRELPVLMPFVHLPVQSGSDSVLQAMGRPYTRAQYLETLEKLRVERPDIAISSDFIVGFPGETEEDFLETLSLVQEVSYAQFYAFKYSPRPGTRAASLSAQVPEGVKEERLARLLEVLNDQQRAFNRRSLHQTVEALMEKPGRKPGEITGRTPHAQPVVVQAPPSVIGSCLPVHITHVLAHSLRGALIVDKAPG
ncbi:MAG: tRNA (N6-isopentenyl adenosine(37)-C2)-methylthiotransferase MiaB [Holosporales bacterium]|jgi:tRNA-2-methylthio-N6-dimethylallyladenosine synthase|nr:tRNA (N6-isopentenyl adenosine(37)-C2)-methylthiotransferase MiaB [Holosporales bacterium]